MKTTDIRNGPGHLAATTYRIEVAGKYGITDAAGSALLNLIPTLGIAGVREVRVCALYDITTHLSSTQMHQVCRDALTDPVTQEYRMDSAAPSPAFLLGPHWRIEVWLKPAVTDPVAGSVCKAITDLGLPSPEQVRTGTCYEILGRVNRMQVEKIQNKILANPVIHQTRIEQK